jgi:hypothetical protein
MARRVGGRERRGKNHSLFPLLPPGKVFRLSACEFTGEATKDEKQINQTGANRDGRNPKRKSPFPPLPPVKVLKTKLVIVLPCLFALLVTAGCASTKVTSQETFVTGPIPRPGNILVYDFAATAAEVPTNSALARQYSLDVTPQTAGQIAIGRQLGIEIAAELVGQIHGMGMPAERDWVETKPQINDIVIRGYLLSINEGNAAKRVTIGYGYGASELRTAVECYQMTDRGLRKLDSETLDAGGNKTPGVASGLGIITFIVTANPAGLIIGSGMKVYGEESGRSKVEGRARATAKEIAVVLKQRFQEQGWID